MTFRLAVFAVPIALVMSARAYRKGSLSRSGAICAVLTGSVAMTASLRLGLVLIAFFLSSSKVTRLGSKRKAELEGKGYAGPGGNRSWVQVLANAGTATALALVYTALRFARVATAKTAVAGNEWLWATTATEERLVFSGQHRVTSLVQLAYVCHYACCNADTWASELGVLSTRPPRLITTGERVRTGTNGGVSILGLGASVAGGFAIGLTFWAAGLALLPWPEDRAADIGNGSRWAFGLPGVRSSRSELCVLLATPLAGAAGSAIDSVLGASLQFSGYCPRLGCVVETPGPGVVRISGRAVLNNHAVNAISSLITAVSAAAIAALLTEK